MKETNWNDARPVGCSVCGKIIREGEVYVENDTSVVCADCTEMLDLCDILEFLDLSNVMELLSTFTDCAKTAK